LHQVEYRNNSVTNLKWLPPEKECVEGRTLHAALDVIAAKLKD